MKGETRSSSGEGGDAGRRGEPGEVKISAGSDIV